MAYQSIPSMLALHNQKLVVAQGEIRSWDWEVVEGEDLYADVESLQSFSISSGDEDDGLELDAEGVHSDLDDIHGQRDDIKAAAGVLGSHLEVSLSEHHPRQLDHGFDFDHGAFDSGDCDVDIVDPDVVEVVGEPNDSDFVPFVGPLGFHVRNSANPVSDLGNRLNQETCGEEDTVDGVIREPQAPTLSSSAMFIRPGEFGVEYCDKVEDNGGDDDDCGYEIDVDDELVPWGVGNRLEKQRMKKLGKRTFARMNKSKKMAHFYIKPACVHGKHGLGLKAY